jgi:uncharacterized protein
MRSCWDFYRRLGATFIQFIPIVVRATGDLLTLLSVGPAHYGHFLIDVSEEWVRRDVGTVCVQMFDTPLPTITARVAGCACTPGPAASNWALEHNGDMYSCDHYVEPGYRLGNIAEKHMMDLIVVPQQTRFGQTSKTPSRVIAGTATS